MTTAYPPEKLSVSRFYCRPLETEQDWWRVHNLLTETFAITGPGFNWELRRWEGGRFHSVITEWKPDLFPDHQLWETQAGRLVGLALREGDEICLQIHPDYRDELEEAMIEYGEAHFAQPNPEGRKQVHMTVYEYDAVRWKLLKKHGYEKMPYGWITRWMRLGNQPLKEPVVASGYQMRVTHPESEGEEHWTDCQRMADLLNWAFNRPGFHQAKEYHNFVTQAPMFLVELNLVMVAPDGTFAAHAALNYDSANRFAIFEPVCTHPEHRQLGLAKALMLEGLRRVRQLGARVVEVSTGDADAANALYDSIGFTEYYKAYAWKKVW
jgi:ribosomal protein S18 acetylase RimI-like enzyme